VKISSSWNDVLLQTLEYERGRIEVYEAALAHAVTDDLRNEWKRNLAQSRCQEKMFCDACQVMALDPEQTSKSRDAVRQVSALLVDAIQTAATKGDADVAERVACKCVLLAETTDYLDWGLLRHVPRPIGAKRRRAVFSPSERPQRHA